MRNNIANKVWEYAYFAFLIATILLYIAIAWQSIHADFFSLDDVGQVYHVREYRSLLDIFRPDLFNFFRPIKNILFVAFNALADQKIELARLLAIAIGILSFIPVNLLCRRILGNSPFYGLLASATWLLAPTMVSSTAWLSCVNIQLGTGLAALSLIFYMRARESDKILNSDVLAAWLTGFLAMLSYEGLVSLPGIYFAIEFFLHPEELRKRKTWLRLLAIWSVLALYLLLRLAVTERIDLAGGFANVTGWQISFSSAYFTLLHLSVWIWPFGRQAIFGGYYWGLISPFVLSMCWLIIPAIVLTVFLKRKKHPVATLGISWFIIAFLPMSNLIPLRNGPYGDYYMTFASIGLAILFSAVVQLLFNKRKCLPFAKSLIVILLLWRGSATLESFRWSSRWNSEFEIYEENVNTFPMAFNVINQLARCHFKRGNIEQSLKLANQSLDIYDAQGTPYLVKALVASRQGEIKKANKLADEVLSMATNKENILWAWDFKGHLYEEFYKDNESAAKSYEKAMAVDTFTWSKAKLRAAEALALIKAQSGQVKEGIKLWNKILVITPDKPAIHNNLSIAYKSIGENEKAREHRNAYIELMRQADTTR